MKGSKPLTVVIKLGTSSIVHEKTHEPLISTLSLIVETAVRLRKDGHKVVLVSSGAIGIALRRMGVPKRPKELPRIQALAAVGQCHLMSLWNLLFSQLGQPIAQILLTRNDIADRTQYLNAQNTFSELLKMGVVPIVNENDTIAVTEIKFGDNDLLSAITAAMVQADYLFLMTDVDCLYTTNPRKDPHAQPVEVVDYPANLAVNVSSRGSALGTGGMATKLVAARLATSAGVTTIITRSSKPGNVFDVVTGLEAAKAQRLPTSLSVLTNAASEAASTLSGSTVVDDGSANDARLPLHTRFLPNPSPVGDRSFWVLYGLAPHGTVYIDRGAHRALRRRANLLPTGVVAVHGHFNQQEAVRLVVVLDHVAAALRPPASRPATPSLSSMPSSAPPTPGGSTPGVSMSGKPSTLGGLSGYEASCEILDGPSLEPAVATPASASQPETPSSRGVPYRARSRPSSVALDGEEVGRALVNYSSAEIERIKGLQSGEIERVLGYAESEYVALRGNVSLLSGTEKGEA